MKVSNCDSGGGGGGGVGQGDDFHGPVSALACSHLSESMRVSGLILYRLMWGSLAGVLYCGVLGALPSNGAKTM